MRGYSTDLRERVIRAWQKGITQAKIAEWYEISVSSIKRYIQRIKETGSVEPRRQRKIEGRITKQHEPALHVLVKRRPEASLVEYCALWQQETGIRVSIKTMSRVLVRLDLRRKKDGRRTGTQ